MHRRDDCGVAGLFVSCPVQYHRVLVPILDRHTDRVLAHAAYIAAQTGAELVVVEVVDGSEEVKASLYAASHASSQLAVACRALRALGADVADAFRIPAAGRATRDIVLDAASAFACDVVVIAAERHVGLWRLFHRSTPEYLSDASSRPAVIVVGGA